MSAFGLIPPPPLSADVLYEWSLRAWVDQAREQTPAHPVENFDGIKFALSIHSPKVDLRLGGVVPQSAAGADGSRHGAAAVRTVP